MARAGNTTSDEADPSVDLVETPGENNNTRVKDYVLHKQKGLKKTISMFKRWLSFGGTCK